MGAGGSAHVPQKIPKRDARFDAARDGSSVDRQLDRLFMRRLTPRLLPGGVGPGARPWRRPPGCGTTRTLVGRSVCRRARSSSWTATSAPAIAKSPWRHGNSCTANPDLLFHTGDRTPVSTSSDSIVVSHIQVKKSATPISRRPRGESTSITASDVRATAGYSPAASACAIEPPRVPRGSEVPDERCHLGNGTAWRTCASAPTLASVVPAAMDNSWPMQSMPCPESCRPSG